jgi:hypothetical protein
LSKPHSLSARQVRADRLDGDTWGAFLEAVIERDRRDGARCRGGRLTHSDRRQLARWLNDESVPTIWSADRFLTRYAIHIDEFFRFSADHGSSGWEAGGPPAWHEEDWAFEDLNWRDELEESPRSSERRGDDLRAA